MSQQEPTTEAPANGTQTRFEFMKKIAVEISNEIYKNVYDVREKQAYDIIGMMAEEREAKSEEIPAIVLMVFAKMFINIHGNLREDKPSETMQ